MYQIGDTFAAAVVVVDDDDVVDDVDDDVDTTTAAAATTAADDDDDVVGKADRFHKRPVFLLLDSSKYNLTISLKVIDDRDTNETDDAKD